MLANPLELLLKYRRLGLEELSRMSGYPREALLGAISGLGGDVRIDGEIVVVANPLGLALRLMERGFSVARLSELISWRDFESVAAEILSAFSYSVVPNVVLTSPARLQVDVVGVDRASGRAVVVDCKHWGKSTRSALRAAAQKHSERVAKMAKYKAYLSSKYPPLGWAKRAVPLIVTLSRPQLRAHSGVLIVSISELNAALRDLDLVLEELGLRPLDF